MVIEKRQIEVRGISVEIVRKDIKNLHLGVYPPNGRVRVAAPLRIDDEAVRLAVISRLGWILRQQKTFAEQVRQSQREMVTGESHYYFGKRYRLDVVEQDKPPCIHLVNNTTMKLQVRPDSDCDKRRSILYRWYRCRLREQLPDLVSKWEQLLGVNVAEVRIKKMKTRWGTCKIEDRRVWLNLELVKKPLTCVEFILVHEMVHLLERHHTDRFRAIMDKYLPGWPLRRAELNRAPLAHDDWMY